MSGTTSAGSEDASTYYTVGMPRRLPVLQPGSGSGQEPSPRPTLVRVVVVSGAMTLLCWAPLASGAQWLGRGLVRRWAGGDAPAVVAEWLARSSEAQRWAVNALLVALPAASFVIAALAAGAVTARLLPRSGSRTAALGVASAGALAWALAALRTEIVLAAASLAVLVSLGFGSGWLGHRMIARRRLDDGPSRR